MLLEGNSRFALAKAGFGSFDFNLQRKPLKARICLGLWLQPNVGVKESVNRANACAYAGPEGLIADPLEGFAAFNTSLEYLGVIQCLPNSIAWRMNLLTTRLLQGGLSA